MAGDCHLDCAQKLLVCWICFERVTNDSTNDALAWAGYVVALQVDSAALLEEPYPWDHEYLRLDNQDELGPGPTKP